LLDENYRNELKFSKAKQEKINEIGDGSSQSYDVSIIKSDDSIKEYRFQTEDNDIYYVNFFKENDYENNWYVCFGIKNKKGRIDYIITTNKGRLFKVMTTISKIMKGFIFNTKPDKIWLEPTKKNTEDRRKFSLYLQYIKKQLPLDYEYIETDILILIKKKLKNTNFDNDNINNSETNKLNENNKPHLEYKGELDALELKQKEIYRKIDILVNNLKKKYFSKYLVSISIALTFFSSVQIICIIII
jgi:hypothetical protein